MKKPTELTEEIKQAVDDLIKADRNYRYGEQPLDSAENKKCRDLGITDEAGCWLVDLPEDIQEYLDQYM